MSFMGIDRRERVVVVVVGGASWHDRLEVMCERVEVKNKQCRGLPRKGVLFRSTAPVSRPIPQAGVD